MVFRMNQRPNPRLTVQVQFVIDQEALWVRPRAVFLIKDHVAMARYVRRGDAKVGKLSTSIVSSECRNYFLVFGNDAGTLAWSWRELLTSLRVSK